LSVPAGKSRINRMTPHPSSPDRRRTIAADVGGIIEIVDLGTGLLAPPEISPSELAHPLARMLDGPERLADFRRSQ
jgi:glycosyltransferase involved in cell wall biosynthesis